MMTTTKKGKSGRLISLDAFRGFTIAAMVIVNDPGSWNHVYPPLLHSHWNGCTTTDLIFPFFLFIVGFSITLAYSKRLESGSPRGRIYRKILIRSASLYLLGLFLWLWPHFDFFSIRWTGVLQRISVVFLACSLLFLNTSWKAQVWIGSLVLLLYWVVMVYLPVPGQGPPDLSVPGKNWANYLDSILLPGVMWQETWDPEGILSTFPAIVTGITGMLAGKLYLRIADEDRKLIWIFFLGFMMYVGGNIWEWFMPVNKNLWTSSYVLYTSGLAAMSLAGCMLIVDRLGYTRWTRLGVVYGSNAIASYVLAGMLTVVFYGMRIGGTSLNVRFMDAATSAGMAPSLASLLYAVAYMLIIYIPALILYRRRIFIRV